uniref:Uncharacterized protein n=1 Tax=viral metagenome TaxID=1070528 RepID=A0A6H1ZEQ2_9ZZZZ
METCPEHQEIAKAVAVIQRDVSESKKTGETILKLLQGNGNPGLITQAALNRESIKRAWWWLGGISLSLLGLVAWALKKI